ncbi:MAG TPA: RNA polymerase sigma-70 factor [Pedobacter sp.]|uniref:RNA polymerase sigma factor n=1 Tax=Pedobacter sp. TaxID=1411316 RepID=UPI002C8075DE|nr:RNA polymerase sigma-70 factor [Pedobacter sp.]HMI01796.1 RNA polymerase sigma-70 factor [Pedobacter sp.]
MAAYSAFTDRQLTELLRTGDRAAYTEIYHRYKRLLYIFAFKRLGDKEEVNDLLHDLFLSIWMKHEEMQLEYALSTYLYNSTRNRIINFVAHKQVSAKYTESFKLYNETEHNTTDHLLRHNELSALIDQEIAALPKKMRQVFELSRKTNYTRKQIAEELGLSEETVKSHMHHAIKILKVRFGPLLVLSILMNI